MNATKATSTFSIIGHTIRANHIVSDTYILRECLTRTVIQMLVKE